MAIFNVLEDLRRRENARRGYSEVKTPLIYDKALWVTSGHWEKFRENMFLIPIDDEHTYAIKPMNCPGHMLLFGSQLRSYRDLPLRYAEAAPLHRNELAGALHGLTRVRYVTQDDAHIFCSQEQVDGELDGCLDYLRYLYGLFGIEPRAELSTRPDNKLGTDEEWDFTEGKLVEALDRHEIEYFVGAGRGLVLRAEDRPAHHRCAAALVAARHDPARRPDAGPLRAHVHGRGQPRAPGLRHPPGVLRLVRALHRHPHRALRGRLPALARPGPGAGARRQRAAPRGAAGDRRRGSARQGFRVEVDERDETLGKRIRDSEVEKVPVVVVFGERESEAALAVRTRGEGQSTRSLEELLADLALRLRVRRRRRERLRPRLEVSHHGAVQPCYAWRLQSRGRYPHLRSRVCNHGLRGFNRVERRGKRCRCLPAVFVVSGKGTAQF